MIQSKDEVLQIYEEDSTELIADDLQNLCDTLLSGYKTEELMIDGIGKPSGIAWLNGELIVTDSEHDRVAICSEDGSILKSVGKTGTGPAEFRSPAAVTAFDGCLYVLDTGNKRIQILDAEMNYMDAIPLKSNDPMYKPQTIAVNEKGIYIGGISFAESAINMYSFNGTHSIIGANFVGPVLESRGTVYAINSMSLFYDKENDSIGAVSTGPEFLFTVDGGEFTKECTLPCGFNIIDFIINDQSMLAASGSAESVFSFDLEGNYIGTVTSIPGLKNEAAPQLTYGENGTVFICLPVSGRIIRIYE